MLIAALVLIWTLVGYKFLSPYFKGKEPVVTAQMLPKKQDLVIKQRDTFVLKALERDPFLAKMYAKKKKTLLKKNVVKKAKLPVVKKTMVEWPEIQYLGFVKSKESSNRLGLLRISGKLHRVKRHHVVDGIKILKIEDSAVILTNGAETKRVLRG